jgi:hypothetical protein
LIYWITFTKGLSNWEKVIKSNNDPQASQQRPKLKQKNVFLGGQIAYQNHKKSVKTVSFEKKHGLMLLVKKNYQKTARGLN